MKDVDFYEKASSEFLELASEIRLKILFSLRQKKSRVSTLAKKFRVTAQEVHRNFDRMSSSGLIAKDKDGAYKITTFGRAICSQIPSIAFLSENKDYFDTHTFGDIPPKFIRRIGDLDDCEYVSGVSMVFERWKRIYTNSNEYIFNILTETPLDLMELILNRVKKGIRYRHIISENATIPKGRRKLLQKMGFDKMLESGMIERRMLQNVSVSIIMNEKEAAIMFPTEEGEPDLRGMFYSIDPYFHDWTLDYFKHSWFISDPFKEFKLSE